MAPQTARSRRILRFAARALVSVWWFELALPRLGFARFAAQGREARMRRLARRFHALAVELGGLMIKVGQFMSSRLDVLPPEITEELSGLQDEVPPVAFAEVRALAEAELGMPLARAYERFEESPLAAASLGQAHRARLAPGLAADAGFADVVVKVQRPGIEQIIEVDLAALRRVAGWLMRVRVVSQRVDAPALVEEFAQTSLAEIDYLHEAANAERFAADFAEDDRVSVPAIAWERTTRRVLTLQDVTALKISDVASLREAGIDPSAVATVFAAVMFDQLFTHGFFHADPHPGNVFVTPLPQGAWRLTFIDFGMMGEISPSVRDGLRTVLIAVASRDGSALIAGIQDIGVLLPSADTRELERAMTALFARFGGMGFAQLRDVDPREMRVFADEFGEVMRSLPFQLPENFLLVIRAASMTSGVCSTLDPDYNVWDSVEPYAARLLRDQGSGVVRDLAQQGVLTASALWRLPRRLDTVITRVEDGRLQVDLSRLDDRLGRLERLAQRILGGVLFTAFLLAAVLLRASDPVFSGVMFVVSAAPLLYALFGARRRRP
ncbi:AarF/ABC1/UbiB kinase family protein [Microbacterium sp. SORGH_AS_0888]|uniref:ABC1 kinase family protein n=1 Tax=Microbacterium sp. SORGH_AS_0888 TaxID=3041791 RepID=UPI00278A9981|nr:AarF/UbiB family protein [Microbacterium sp. SORGH_AS_0888]MDQ1130819.1 putative unusual protein kinase regulating ubiquinone biosynthesis (AarF/ABC1/UbiB family) [Microbacterium sp. SORGH_AS_0888]